MSQTRIDGDEWRSGLSLIEVVVVLGVLLLLAAFLGPAFQSAKTSPRKLFCLNNIRQIGIAIENFAASDGGSLPPLVENYVVRKDGESPATGTLVAGWPVFILPAIDNMALLKKIRQNAVVLFGRAPDAVLGIGESERIHLNIYTCPDDTDSHKRPGGLSYVVNAGFLSRSLYHGDPDGLHRVEQLSWDGNDVAGETADIEVAAATGVFWRKSEAFQPSLEYISEGDGTTQTILLSENLQAGNWWDIDTTRLAFGLPVATVSGRVPFGSVTFFESVERPLNTLFHGGTLTSSTPRDWRINSDLKAATGTRPRPSSNHTDGVNVIMCDGSGKFLSDRIDPHVYAKLLTANGVKYGEGELKQSSY